MAFKIKPHLTTYQGVIDISKKTMIRSPEERSPMLTSHPMPKDPYGGGNAELPGDDRRPSKRRPRSAWLVIFFCAAFLVTVFIFVSSVTSIHTSSLRSIPSNTELGQSSSLHTNYSNLSPLSQQSKPQLNQDNRRSNETANKPVQPLPHTKHESTTNTNAINNNNFQQHVSQSLAPLSSQNEQEKLSFHAPTDYPHQCYLQHSAYDVNASDSYYPFNSRSFCLASSICIQPSTETESAIFYSAASLERTTCFNVTAGFEPHENQQFNCSHVQDLVHLPHGRFAPPRTPIPPRIRSFSSLTNEQLNDARWINGIVFQVPAFPHMGNIFHFSYVAGSVGLIASAIPALVKKWRGQSTKLPNPIPVTIMLRGGLPHTFGKWQTGVMNLLINQRLQRAGLLITLATMNESVIGDTDGTFRSKQLTCSRSNILLGSRSHINLWPFPSNRWIPVDGSFVPIESVSFRKAAYDAVNIHSLLPSLPSGSLTPPPKTALFDLPPRAVGYSRRNSFADFQTTGRKFQEGTVRIFSEPDEKWFISMLKNVSSRYNFSYMALETNSNMEFEDQVSLYSKIGYVAGIHGANLMNAIFMRPFGGIMELFAGRGLQCYIAGANSGLSYHGYHPVKRASSEASGCYPQHPTCWQFEHARRVLISDGEDHRRLTAQVEQAVIRIDNLHRKFGYLGGIPVIYKPDVSAYTIDWEKAWG